ncbi:acyltransferase family protein [bacterium]|nr:acyltransferase family protein [bacterium]
MDRWDPAMKPAEPSPIVSETAARTASNPEAISNYRGPHAAIPAPEEHSKAAATPDSKPARQSAHFPMIDVLRGFAAVTVIVYHVIEHLKWAAFPNSGPAVWFRLGWMSVDLFFVISGFVITMSAVRGFSKSNSPRQFRREYLRRRLTRIVPLHYLTCLVYVVFVLPAMLSMQRIGFHLWTHAAFVHNWHPATQGSINGVNWSLGVEMQFYLIVMLAAGWLARVRPRVLVGTCLGIAWAWRAAAYMMFHGQTAFGANLTWVYTSQVFGMLDFFGWGGALALLIANDTDGSFRRRWIDRWWIPAALAALVAWPAMRIYWPNASYWDRPAMVVFWRSSMGLVWALVIAAACGLGAGRISRWAAPLRYLGTISYGLYLWHLPVIDSLKKTALPNAPDRFLAVTLLLTGIFAAGSWHFFEKPLMDKYGK